MFLKQVVRCFLATAFLIFTGLFAHADFRVCNSTQKTVGVAIGYWTTIGWRSEGWWQVRETSCKTLIKGPLLSRFYYFYAEDADGVGRWNGTVNMCASERKFKINGVKNCFIRGFQRLGFQEIDTENKTSWMVQLVEHASIRSSLNNL